MQSETNQYNIYFSFTTKTIKTGMTLNIDLCHKHTKHRPSQPCTAQLFVIMTSLLKYHDANNIA